MQNKKNYVKKLGYWSRKRLYDFLLLIINSRILLVIHYIDKLMIFMGNQIYNGIK